MAETLSRREQLETDIDLIVKELITSDDDTPATPEAKQAVIRVGKTLLLDFHDLVRAVTILASPPGVRVSMGDFISEPLSEPFVPQKPGYTADEIKRAVQGFRDKHGQDPARDLIAKAHGNPQARLSDLLDKPDAWETVVRLINEYVTPA